LGQENQAAEHAVVVGGTRGAGRALVRLLDREGFRVSVVGRSCSEGDPRLPNTAFFPADVTKRGTLPEIFARMADINGPVQRLAFFQRFRGKGDAWEGEIAVGPTATRDVIEVALGVFAPEGDRSICVVTSNAARCVAVEQPVGYHVAKAGLVQLVRYFAAQLGPRGIRVNCVSPSALIKEESLAFYEGFVELKRLYSDISPLGRMGTAEELASVCRFFLGSASSFVTGQELVFDGGLSLPCHEGVARKIACLPHPASSS
jgi:NAD(P)-dependent dehydrogenase (short-subunit alcohol dehydrogenase family)